MENYIKLLETNNGEFISASALEVTSIPKISILKDDYAPTDDIENEIKLGLGNLISEIYQSYKSFSATNNSAEISLELLWMTEPVINQPYKAKIRIFVISRAINNSENSSNEMVYRVLSSCEAALKLHKYGTQRTSISTLENATKQIETNAVHALVKDEHLEVMQNEMLPA